MQESRALIVANSVYQLLTAVHMRRTILNDWDVDLIVTDITPQLRKTVPRLEETNLFDRVIFGATLELSKKYAGAKDEQLSEGFGQIERIFRWALSEELGNYGAVYFSNFDPFTRMLACHYYTQPCAFIWYENGFSSYVIDYLREDRAAINQHPEGRKIRDKVECVLLYEPHLAMRGDHLPNRALPKISRQDTQLRELLNHIFTYEKPEKGADFVFLEQSFRAEGLKNNDIALMRECQQTVGSSRFIVKPHPRNLENVPFQLGLTRRYPHDIPWELFLLNEDSEDTTVITVCSNGALTGQLVFGLDTYVVMLYRLFEEKVLWKEDEILKRYLQKFQKHFAGENYYVPQTAYELRSVLRYLAGS